MSADVAVFIGRALRTPVGRERGGLASFAAPDLAAPVIRTLSRAASLDRVLLACVAANGNVARVAALAAGIDPSIPALTLNGQCSGGLTAIRLGVEAIRAGGARLVLAGGVESVSQSAVWLGPGGPRRGDDAALPRVSHAPPPYADPGMGAASDALAARLGITRDDQDAWSHQSYARYARAAAAGSFAPLLVPLGAVATDELAGRIPDPSRLARLRPAFGEGGTVTAGNAAALGDGAAAVLLGAREALVAAGIEPIARVLVAVAAAGDPAEPPVAALAAIERALAAARLAAPAIDAWEINEAFAAKVVACIRHFGLDPARVNPGGGALAYGHPFSASGAILAVHAAARMRSGATGPVMLAIAGAGGLGEAMLLAPP